ncbi:ABC transporter permease subunit [Pirellulales bacterium]|nr:ABC transporter permease subunit [Pirellulales bacterium]
MYLFENPVLQRELVVNLRMTRSFVLLVAYVGLLGLLVYAAWPADQQLDLARPEKAKALVDLFFFGQYVLVSMMTPSFAAGAITGEKERNSYEMLMASPIRPGAIVLGKLAASLCHLAILMICSLPIVMLCLPLGGVHPSEVLAGYVAMLSSVLLFGMISLWCSGFFSRTSASLVVSYLLILPLAMLGVLTWQVLEQLGPARLWIAMTVVPAACVSLAILLWSDISRRLMRAPELGSEGKQVIDLATEAEEAVGLYINRDDFPDRLFAPPKRTTFLPDQANPIYDKEIRSEIFSHGTLMLRLVIQISMFLALPVMAVCLYLRPQWAPWFIAYVLLFNMLVGPVFSAGSITSERERQTLDLLLTTLITPWQMLWGKLFSGLRVSSVLTGFLMWPVVLAAIMPGVGYWSNLPTIGGFFLIVAVTSVTTAMTALFCSTLFRKSSTALIAAYLISAVLFLLPPAANWFCTLFLPDSPVVRLANASQVFSPFAAAFHLPLDIKDYSNAGQIDVGVFWGHLAFGLIYNLVLLVSIAQLFNVRWRVSE